MIARLAALGVAAALIAGCGSGSSGGGGGGSESAGSGGPLSDTSSCLDWNRATAAQRRAYTKPLQARAQRGDVDGFLRDTCESITDDASAAAIRLGPTVTTIVGD